MRLRLPLLLLPVALVACQDQPSGPSDAAPVQASFNSAAGPVQPERVMPGEVVVKLEADSDPAEVARGHGLAVAGRGYRNAFTVMKGAVGNEHAIAARLARDSRVVYAEPNYLRQTTEIDPRVWALYNPGGLSVRYTRGGSSGQPVGNYLSTTDADEDGAPGGSVGDYGAAGAPVVIGSIDTGVDFDHPEFAGVTLMAGSDWYSGDDDPSDTDGHGTHTTGTMVGRTVGVAGAAGATQVAVYVQRVCGPRGCPLSAIASAIREAADVDGMVAMNLSLGGASLGSAEADAIDYATAKGVLVIASAGNDGSGTIGCPACDPDAISVAATNWQDDLAYYSNWGAGLDISAPGGELYSNTTDEAGVYSAVPGGYAFYQGTSMAAPQVTGTAGVVASVSGLRGVDLRARLESSTDDLGAPGYDETFGNGRVNTYRAVTGNSLPVDEGSGTGTENGSPTASFTYSCTELTCAFDASSSSDPDGDVLSYAWDFGDGASATGATPGHTYGAAGSYAVTVTVDDGNGGSDAATQNVTVSEPSTSTFSLTASGYKVKGVQFVDFTWTGAAGATVYLYENGSYRELLTGENGSGEYTLDRQTRGGGSAEYKVCNDSGGTDCSNTVTVNF